jgi:hypothetical protein
MGGCPANADRAIERAVPKGPILPTRLVRTLLTGDATTPHAGIGRAGTLKARLRCYSGLRSSRHVPLAKPARQLAPVRVCPAREGAK